MIGFDSVIYFCLRCNDNASVAFLFLDLLPEPTVSQVLPRLATRALWDLPRSVEQSTSQRAALGALGSWPATFITTGGLRAWRVPKSRLHLAHAKWLSERRFQREGDGCGLVYLASRQDFFDICRTLRHFIVPSTEKELLVVTGGCYGRSTILSAG